MALVLKDRVKETTLTTGTGSFALAGAVTGYDSFGQIGSGNTTYYAVYLDGGSEWEVGIGTYTSPSTLSRDTILASSNAGSVVTFSAGQKTIWCDYPAGKAVYTDASGSISEPIVNISGITGHINTPDYIAFDTAYATTLAAGQLGWNGNDTLGLGMIGGNVIQHIGEDVFFYVKASATITKGQLCMFTGAVGSSGVLTAAPSTAIPFAEAIIGVAAENIANNAFGLVQSVGTLRGVNTSAFLDGDILYYNSAVTGGFTKTFPASGPIVIAAAVAKAGSGGSGVLTIRISFQTRVTAGTAMSVTQGNDVVTVTNTAPDQTVSIASGTGISATGTYPAFTVTNTGVTSAVAGTGISVSSGTGAVTVTNTAPDQTVAISSGTGISVTGTYPSFTVTNTAPDVPFTYTSTYIPFGQGTTTPNQSANLTFDGTTQAAPIQRASNGIVTNNKTIGTSFTIPSTDNAMSSGPVTLSSGVTVTVSSGSRWVVL
jgi:hypothetical protein